MMDVLPICQSSLQLRNTTDLIWGQSLIILSKSSFLCALSITSLSICPLSITLTKAHKIIQFTYCVIQRGETAQRTMLFRNLFGDLTQSELFQGNCMMSCQSYPRRHCKNMQVLGTQFFEETKPHVQEIGSTATADLSYPQATSIGAWNDPISSSQADCGDH